MANIRCLKNKDNPYVQLNRKTLQNFSLSFGARGLWGYLLSQSDNWCANVEVMARQGKEKKHRIYALLKELKENNLCLYVQPHEGGRLQGGEYLVFETPEELKKYLLLSENQKPENQRPNKEEKEEKKERKKNPPQKKERTFSQKREEEDSFSSSKKKPIKPPPPKASKPPSSANLESKLKETGRTNPKLLTLALQKLKEQPLGEIKSPLSWLKRVYDNLLDQEKMNDLVEFRKRFVLAKKKSWLPGKDKVTVLSGSLETSYSYRGNEEFWVKHGLGMEDYLKHLEKIEKGKEE